MNRTISRRSLVGSGAALGATAVLGSKASLTFAAPSVVGQTGSKVTVNYWTSFGSGVNGDAQAKLVADFNAANPDIEVVAVPYESYETIAQALITGLQTGDTPDLTLFSEAWWFRFYLAGVLVDMNSLIKPETKAEDYNEVLFKEYQRNGGQWAIPFARSTPLLYYNNEMLERSGLMGDVFAKWSNLKAQGKDLIAASGAEQAFAFGNAAGYGAWYLQGTVWGFNGGYSDPDLNVQLTEPGAVEAGDAMRGLVADGIAAAVTDPVQSFTTGGTVATFGSTGSLGGITSTVKFDFKTAFLPAEYTFGCCTGGSGLAMLNTSPDEVQQAAFKFIEYCTSTEITSFWSQTTGYMPVRTSARDSDAMQTFFADHPNSKTAVDQLEKTRQVDSVMVSVPNGAQIIGQGWEQILVNGVSAADAWAGTKETLDVEKEPILEAIKELEG